MKSVDVRISGYFSTTIMVTAAAVFIIGILATFTNIAAGVILCFVCMVILTTHYRLKVDPDRKEYHDYVWILGLKNGERGKFDNIEYLYILKSKVSQTMSLRVVSSTIRKDVFDGYLKFSENKKIHLLTRDDKADLVTKLRPMAQQLKVKILDYSTAEPMEI